MVLNIIHYKGLASSKNKGYNARFNTGWKKEAYTAVYKGLGHLECLRLDVLLDAF